MRGGRPPTPPASANQPADPCNNAEIPSKIVTRLHTGDRVVVETAGGAGYGDPALRHPDAMRDDIADGKVTG